MTTKIEWVARPGTIPESWNPVTGCTKISEGCRNCYAERMARRLAGRCGYPEAPQHFDVTLHPEKIKQPLGWKKPRTIFVASMSDLFHEDVPDEFILRVFDTIGVTPQHIYMILTKRPLSMLDWYEKMTREGFLAVEEPDGRICDNVWLGVSVENQEWADKRRADFKAVPGAIKFASYEPALGPVDWTGWEFVDQIISGGESGPKARPSHPDWHRAARDFCQENGIAYFLKQNGEYVLAYESPGTRKGADWIGYQGEWFRRVGKKQAGHLLDGQVWHQWPQ